MRERTTWNRDQIRQASMSRRADPYTMNQDHPQPAADEYVTGGPSDFAEDVTPTNRWEEEYKGGQVDRNEIGMPEMRGDTFNHAEKTASHEVLLKKADLTVKVARMMLPKTASEAAVEDQAYALMYVPDAELIQTFDRLANDDQQDQGQDQGEQAKEEPKKEEPKEQAKEASQDQMSALQQQAQQAIQALQSGDQVQAQQAIQAMVQQAMQQQGCKMANEVPAQQAAQQQMAQQQAQQAAQQQMAQQQATMLAQQVQQMVQQAMQQQAQQQMPPAQAQQQVPPAAQQQMPPAQAQQQVPPAAQQMPVEGDDALLDTMLMDEAPINDMGIQMEAPVMDVGDVELGPEDDVLRQLFANQQEVKDAEEAQQLQGGGQQKQAMTRTAATRTVGTRPTQGVSKIGGTAAAPAPRSAEIDKLSSLWQSAPDVSAAFGLK